MKKNSTSKERERTVARRFAQLNFIRDYRFSETLTGTAATYKAILFAIVTRFDDDDQWAIGLKRLAADAGLKSRQHLSRRLADLERLGLITRERRSNQEGYRIADRYRSGPALQTLVAFESSLVASESKAMDSKATYITYTDNTTTNYTEKSVEKIPEVVTSGKTNSDSQSKTPGEETDIETWPGYSGENVRRDVALKILGNYRKPNPTTTSCVGYWWALMHEFFPGYAVFKTLPTPQHEALKGLFRSLGDQAYFVIASSVCDWNVAAPFAVEVEGYGPEVSSWRNGYAGIPKCGPTPNFILSMANGFARYHDDHWVPALQAA